MFVPARMALQEASNFSLQPVAQLSRPRRFALCLICFLAAAFTIRGAGTLEGEAEPLGPSSRRTGLVLSEIMYHPAPRTDGRNLEYVELYNTQPVPESLGGYRLTGSIEYTFPSNAVIPSRSYLVVAKSPADVQAVHGIQGVLGPYSGSLENSRGTVRLRHRLGAVQLEAVYSGDAPWPAAADGGGHSLVLARPSYGEGSRLAWQQSAVIGGSPRAAEPAVTEPSGRVVINEVFAAGRPEDLYVELHNPGKAAFDLSACTLTDGPSVHMHLFPSGTVLPSGGYRRIAFSELPFPLRATGGKLFLRNRFQNRVLDAVAYPAHEAPFSAGRYPDGTADWQLLEAPTPSASNRPPRVAPVVISEIMYHPISSEEDEFVELTNRSQQPVNLSGWRLEEGIEFVFPEGAWLPPGTALAVVRNRERFLARYPQVPPARIYGNFSGRLSNSGERISLVSPALVPLHGPGGSVPSRAWIPVNAVEYGTGGRWGLWSDGGGSSLELVDLRSDNRQASAWADSDESAKGEWITMTRTGELRHGSTAYPIDALQLLALGAGEFLVDDLEVREIPALAWALDSPPGANLLSNPSFAEGSQQWSFDGNHHASFVQQTGGMGDGPCLKVVAAGRGDTGANRVQGLLAPGLASGDVALLRMRVRWLRGHPEMLLRLRGNWLELAGKVEPPAHLGTPAQTNSRSEANGPPLIWDVSHVPTLPVAGTAVRVVARVHDPDGVGSVQLVFRRDPETSWQVVSMNDEGLGGDPQAGDGVYTAQLPLQGNGTLVAFYVQAADRAAPQRFSKFPAHAPDRECLVRYGESVPIGLFGSYHLWMTQSKLEAWSARLKLSNEPLDATFVNGRHRIIYNAGALYSGSPYKQGGWNGPTNNFCDYVLVMPEDDLFLGQTDFVMALIGNNENDPTGQREQTIFWLAGELGLPFNHRRHVHFFFNGLRRGTHLMEDAQQPGGDLVRQWYPDDSEGDLHKIEDWFEFNSTTTSFSRVDATLEDFTTTGRVKMRERYRWNWRKRALQESAHDYEDLFALVDAVNQSDTNRYGTSLAGAVHMEQWTRVFAVERIFGNWDSYGYERGKNMYAYKPTRGKWELLMWDIDQYSEVNDDLFSDIDDPVVVRMMNHPPFRRAYWRALHDAVNGPMVASRVDSLLDARYQAFQASLVGFDRPDSLKAYVRDRRAYIQSQLANLSSAFAIASNGGADFSTSTNLVQLSGIAPVSIRTLTFNQIARPARWTTVTNWTVEVPLEPGLNPIRVEGWDSQGRPVAGASREIQITYTGEGADPRGLVVVNEIHYHPEVPQSGYVELWNRSAHFNFDLSRWRLEGVGLDFPDGTLLRPGMHAVVVEDAAAFQAVYGSDPVILCEYPGRLDRGGETLRLIRPGVAPMAGTVVDEVTYDDTFPWPGAADGGGSSLQLVDATQDRNRSANWHAVPTPPLEWQFVSLTGLAAGDTNLLMYLEAQAEVHLDDLTLRPGGSDGGGGNLLRNPGFESPLEEIWHRAGNHQRTERTATVQRSGSASLRLRTSRPGADRDSSVWQNLLPLYGEHTLSFWFLPNPNGARLTVRLGTLGVGTTVDTRAGLAATRTPGAPNNVQTNLAPFAPVWLNEILPENRTGITDRFGEREPWAELYNSGPAPVSMDNYFLSADPDQPAQWAFPSGTVIPGGGYLLVWLDAEPGESEPGELHASFRPNPSSGTVLLSRTQANGLAVVDFLSYRQILPDESYGAYPEGQSRHRHAFAVPSPRGENKVIPPVIRINEWMASNVRAHPDPADGDYEDWLELYNPNPVDVHLAGWMLSDDPMVPEKAVFSSGVVIPARSFLLLWADEEPGQTAPGALHLPFRLSRSGETVVLRAPDRSIVDEVQFGAQLDDVAEGRFPDGAAPPFRKLGRPTPGAPNRLEAEDPPIQFVRLERDGSFVHLEWTATPGTVYVIEYAEDLASGSWVTLPGEITAGGVLAGTSDSPGGAGHRFYRVRKKSP